jgi:hypothetical protein
MASLPPKRFLLNAMLKLLNLKAFGEIFELSVASLRELSFQLDMPYGLGG